MNWPLTQIANTTIAIATVLLLGCDPSQSNQSRNSDSQITGTSNAFDAFVVMSNELYTPKIFYAPPGSSNAWVNAKNSQRVASPPPFIFQNRDYPRAQKITCVNNLKQIGLAFCQWAVDNDDRFPGNVSTNAGGAMEFCAVGRDGFDRNAARHFQVMSNELSTPRILVCPQDKARKPAADFVNLQAGNVTYQLRSGTNVSELNPREVLVVCPIDGNILYCDGRVVEATKR